MDARSKLNCDAVYACEQGGVSREKIELSSTAENARCEMRFKYRRPPPIERRGVNLLCFTASLVFPSVSKILAMFL